MSEHVIKFALAMQVEMEKNSHKTGWWRLTPRQCLYHLRQELKEVSSAVYQNKSKEEVRSECADVANFCMFLAHNYKQKREEA